MNDENKNKGLWKAVSKCLNQTKMKTQVITLTDDDGRKIPEDDVCETLGRFYSNAASNLIKETFKDTGQSSNCTTQSMNPYSMFCSPILPEVVLNIISGLKKNSHSKGFDEGSVKAVKFIGDIIMYPLTTIINFLISDRVFPSALKIAPVIPIYKNGDYKSGENYRPLSVLSVFS